MGKNLEGIGEQQRNKRKVKDQKQSWTKKDHTNIGKKRRKKEKQERNKTATTKNYKPCNKELQTLLKTRTKTKKKQIQEKRERKIKERNMSILMCISAVTGG